MADTATIQSIQTGLNQIKSNIATNGIQDDSGKTLVAPTLPSIPSTQTVNTNTSAATSYSAGTQAYIDSQQKAAADAKAQETAAQANQTPAPTSLDSYLQSQGAPTVGTFTQNEWNSTGINATDYFAQQKAYTAQISSLQKTIDTATQAKDQQISDMTGRTGVTLDFQNNAIAQITRNYNVSVATPLAEQSRVSALMAQNSSDFNQAQGFVKDAVAQYTSVAEADLKQFDDFLTNNQHLIDNLETKQQTALKNAYDAAQTDLASQKADLTQKLNMAVNAGLTVSTDQLSKMSLIDVAALAAKSTAQKNAQAAALTQSEINKNNAAKAAQQIAQSIQSLNPYVKTSYDGTQYVDLSTLTGKAQTQAAQTAFKAGIPTILNTGDAAKISAIADAKTNLSNIQNSLKSINLGTTLPGLTGIGNSIASAMGNDKIKSYAAWRTAIINNVQALAGGAGSGLRITKAEIDAAMNNDLPVITGLNADSPTQAAGKLAILNTQLDAWTKQLLGGGNTAASTQASQSQPSQIMYQGKKYNVDTQGNMTPAQ